MNQAAEILLIIVSSVLTIFLLVSIVAGILVVKILRDVRRLTVRAEQVIESAEAVGEVLKNASGPVAIFKVVQNIVKTVKKK